LWQRLWVAELFISDRTAQKITQRHGITPDEVRDAIVCTAGLTYVWQNDLARGLRAIVQANIRGRRVLLVLYPARRAEDDEWHLGSAYPVRE
jgi:hypothetical protein